MDKPTVHIEKWTLWNGSQLTGEVSDHPNFLPGTLVVTSLILNPIELDNLKTGDEVETRNTLYILGAPV